MTKKSAVGTFFSLLASMCMFFEANAQGTCATATNIPSLPYNTNAVNRGNTCGNGNTYTDAHTCANTYMNGEDYVYSFTPATNMCIAIEVKPVLPASANGAVFLTEGCPDQPGSKCIAQDINTIPGGSIGKNARIENVAVKAGVTYYIIVSSIVDCYTFDLNVGGLTCAPVIPGESCAEAIPITTLDSLYSGANCSGTEFMNTGNGCNGGSYGAENIQSTIYRYDSPADQCLLLSLLYEAYDITAYIYEGCPTDFGAVCILQTSEMVNFQTKAGKSYYFVFTSVMDCVDFKFQLSQPSFAGDNCSAPNDISLPYAEDFTFLGCYKNDFTGGGSCVNPSAESKDVVYRFTAKANECIGIDILAQGFSGKVFLTNKCPSDPSANCIMQDSIRMNKLQSLNFTSPYTGTYYLVISGGGKNLSFYNFSIASSGPLSPEGIDCASAVQIPQIPYSSPTYSTGCKNNDYGSQISCYPVDVTRNEDFLYVFNPTKDICANVIVTDLFGKGSVSIVENCPDSPGSNCIKGAYSENNCDSILLFHRFLAGKTYYFIASSDSGCSIFQFKLALTEISDSIENCLKCGTSTCDACKNINFETSTFSNWQAAYGLFANPYESSGFVSGAINAPLSRHTLISRGYFDPVVGPALRGTSPIGNSMAARLGNRFIHAEAEVLEYSFTVSPENEYFYYSYAIVFEDPGHPSTVQPSFSVTMRDAGGSAIDCAEYYVTASKTAPGFKETRNRIAPVGEVVVYKDWELVAVPLTAYLGQTVTISFTTRDCSAGGHFGYAYIDAFCDPGFYSGNKTIYLCEGDSVQLMAPPGFKSYAWNTGQTTQQIMAKTGGNYTVSLTTYGSQDCGGVLSYQVVVTKKPKAAFSVNTDCTDNRLDFVDASTQTGSETITSWHWEFGDGATSDEKNPFHFYAAAGNYDVTLIVTNGKGCSSTITQNIRLAPYPAVPALNLPDSIFACEGSPVAIKPAILNGFKYKWTGPNSFSSTTININFPAIQKNQEGTYYLEATDKNDPCIKTYDTVFVKVFLKPVYTISKDTAICFRQDSIHLKAIGGDAISWTPAVNFANAYAPESKVGLNTTTTFTATIDNKACPDTTIKINVTVYKPSNGYSIPSSILLCLFDTLNIKPGGDPAARYQWTGPNSFSQTQQNVFIPEIDPIHEGWYKLTSYVGPVAAACLYQLDSFRLTVNSLPTVYVNPDEILICPGDTVLLTAGGAQTYTWSYYDLIPFSSKDFVSIPVDTNTTLFTEGFDIYGCKGLANSKITVKSSNQPDLGPDIQFCSGGSSRIGINLANFSIQPDSVFWNTGAKTDSITVTNSGTYIVHTAKDGCIKSDSLKVTVISPASFTIGNDTNLCTTDSLVIDLNAYSGSASWNDGILAKRRVFTQNSGTYWVTLNTGICTLSDTIKINFSTPQTNTFQVKPAYCKGDSIILGGLPIGTHSWLIDGLGYNSDTVVISKIGQNKVNYSNFDGVCTVRDSVIVNITTPEPLFLGPDTSVCLQLQLTVPTQFQSGYPILWSNGVVSNSISVLLSDTISVTANNGVCTSTDTIIVQVDTLPLLNLGPDFSFCEIASATLSNLEGDISSTYLWNTGSTNFQLTATLPGLYFLTLTNGVCTTTDSVVLQMDTLPYFDLGPDQLICIGDTLTLTVNSGWGSYNWSNGNTSNSLSIADSGTYHLTVVNHTCSYADTVELKTLVPPVLSLGQDQSICIGDSVKIGTTIIGDAYTWNTGANTPFIWVTEDNSYILSLNYGPCLLHDTVALNVSELLPVALGADSTICEGDTISLNIFQAGASYLWENGDTSSSRKIAADGEIWVEVRKGTCIEVDTMLVIVHPRFQVNLSPDSTLCIGTSYLLNTVTSANNPSYLWNNGQTTPQISVTTSGLYRVEVSEGPCTVSDSVQATFVPTPVANLGADRPFCQGDSVVLQSPWPGANYKWSTGVTTTAITVKTSGLYSVSLSLANCSDADTILLSTDLPIPVDLGKDLAICTGESTSLSCPIAPAILWSTGSTTYFTNISQAGYYWAQLTNGACVTTDSLYLNLLPLPEFSAISTVICPDDSLLVDLSCTNCSVQWFDQPSNPSSVRHFMARTINQAIVTNQEGCKTTVDIQVRLDLDCPLDLYVPTAFSPNGDKVNDVFIPIFSDIQPIDFYVFNRWGERIHTEAKILKGWDGKYLGEWCKTDVYLWEFTFVNKYGKNERQFGQVNLIR